jgi:hypothetical protein
MFLRASLSDRKRYLLEGPVSGTNLHHGGRICEWRFGGGKGAGGAYFFFFSILRGKPWASPPADLGARFCVAPPPLGEVGCCRGRGFSRVSLHMENFE